MISENIEEQGQEQQQIEEQEQSHQQHSEDRQSDIVTMVLTADNHLGYAAYGQSPHKREERQQRLRFAFQQVVDFAIGQGVDLFIQAGDLFDTVHPDERDRSFVAERLARLKQAGVRTFAISGIHDTPSQGTSSREAPPAPQVSYASLGALHYFPPAQDDAQQPVVLDVHGVRVGIAGLSVLADQEGDPLSSFRVHYDIERAHVKILVLHAPVEGLTSGTSLLDTRALVHSSSIEQQQFGCILAGYQHMHSRRRIGQAEVIVAGSTQHIDFRVAEQDATPGFVYIGLAADGIRWCRHFPVDTLQLRRLTLHVKDLWPAHELDREHKSASLPAHETLRSAQGDGFPTTSSHPSATDIMLEQLAPLCHADTMVQLRLVGDLTHSMYHQLDLNQIRRYGEEHCFALAIDDSALILLPEQDMHSGAEERLSPREELIALADEWIRTAPDEQEKKALRATKEELLLAMDEI